MRYTAKQRQLLLHLDGRIAYPPQYAFGGLAVALARLKGHGLVDRNTNKLTPLGQTILSQCQPVDRKVEIALSPAQYRELNYIYICGHSGASYGRGPKARVRSLLINAGLVEARQYTPPQGSFNLPPRTHWKLFLTDAGSKALAEMMERLEIAKSHQGPETGP